MNSIRKELDEGRPSCLRKQALPPAPLTRREVVLGGLAAVFGGALTINAIAIGTNALNEEQKKREQKISLKNLLEVEQYARLEGLSKNPDMPEGIHIDIGRQSAAIDTSTESTLQFTICDKENNVRFKGYVQSDHTLILFIDRNGDDRIERRDLAITFASDDDLIRFLKASFPAKQKKAD